MPEAQSDRILIFAGQNYERVLEVLEDRLSEDFEVITLLSELQSSDGWSLLPGTEPKPVIVGHPNFFHERFGNFAIFPDQKGIGLQISEMAYKIMENEWTVTRVIIKEPHAIHKRLHLGFAKRHLGLREHLLGEIDSMENDGPIGELRR